jgi:hypothetical protein
MLNLFLQTPIPQLRPLFRLTRAIHRLLDSTSNAALRRIELLADNAILVERPTDSLRNLAQISVGYFASVQCPHK